MLCDSISDSLSSEVDASLCLFGFIGSSIVTFVTQHCRHTSVPIVLLCVVFNSEELMYICNTTHLLVLTIKAIVYLALKTVFIVVLLFSCLSYMMPTCMNKKLFNLTPIQSSANM